MKLHVWLHAASDLPSRAIILFIFYYSTKNYYAQLNVPWALIVEGVMLSANQKEGCSHVALFKLYHELQLHCTRSMCVVDRWLRLSCINQCYDQPETLNLYHKGHCWNSVLKLLILLLPLFPQCNIKCKVGVYINEIIVVKQLQTNFTSSPIFILGVSQISFFVFW